jgi:hypothetical protein
MHGSKLRKLEGDRTMKRMILGRLGPGIAAGLLCFGLASTLFAAPTGSIEVAAPDQDYVDCPVSVIVQVPASAQSASLTDAKSDKKTPCQLSREGGQVTLTWILPELKRGSSLTYNVAFSDAAQPVGDGIVIRPGEEAAEVLIGGALFTRYVIAGGPKPYCYPIIGPTGKYITRNYPMKTVEGEATDHPHQRSLWFTHGEVNGVSYWHEGAKAGKQTHRGFDVAESGPVVGRIRARADWVEADGKKVCEDVRDLRFYKVARGQLFDWTITVKATGGTVKFGDTKEGTFGFRVATTMRTDKKLGGKILNSEGQTDGDAWGKRAAWCDYSGPVEGETVGIAVFDHPTSFRHPTYWHVRTYGLFAANPFGLHDFVRELRQKREGDHTLKQGESTTFRYRVWIHRGTAEEAGVAETYAEYANPPKVSVR